MSVTFLHTADWQLGKPFARVADPDKRALIRQERLNVIARIGQVAKEHGASFLLVAGDLFDTPTVGKATVSQAFSAIGQLGIPVLVIPGNHDHGGPGCLWEQDFFLRERDSLAPNLRLLLEATPVELERAVIFPCPLLRRHEAVDPSAWLRDLDESVLAGFGDKVRLVLAHGSTQDFEGGGDDEDGSGGVPNLIDLERLPPERFDYFALGDWHGTKAIGEKAWYAGTPEPDRFPKGADNAPGNVLVVKAARGGMPGVETVPTACLGWHQMAFAFASDDEVSTFEGRLGELLDNRAARDLLRLELQGSLGIEATTRLESILEALDSRLLRLKLANHTVIAPTGLEVEALTRRTGDPLTSRVAAQLVELLNGSGEEAALAHIALRELHAAVTSRP